MEVGKVERRYESTWNTTLFDHFSRKFTALKYNKYPHTNILHGFKLLLTGLN